MLDEDSELMAGTSLEKGKDQGDTAAKGLGRGVGDYGDYELFWADDEPGQIFFELSSGALVFRKTSLEEMQILLIRHKHAKYWGFPKGHVKRQETCKRAAIREVQEETGIHIEIECDFEEHTCREISSGLRKKVVYFLAVERSGQITKNNDKMIRQAAFFNVDESFGKLMDQSKIVLSLALEYLEKHKELF